MGGFFGGATPLAPGWDMSRLVFDFKTSPKQSSPGGRRVEPEVGTRAPGIRGCLTALASLFRRHWDLWDLFVGVEAVEAARTSFATIVERTKRFL